MLMNIRISGKSLFRLNNILVLVCLMSAYSIVAQEAKTAETAASLYNDGLALLKEKNYEEGLVFMEKALAKATEDNNEQIIGLSKKNGAIASYNLGKAKLKANALDEASEIFSKGAEMDETYSSNFLGLARVLDNKKMYQDAMDAYFLTAQKAEVAGKQKKVNDAQNRARAIVTKLYKAKSHQDVVDRGTQFLSKVQNASVSYYVGKSLMELKNYQEAVTHLDDAISNSETGKDKMIYAKAMSLEKLGNNSEAVAAYKQITDEKYKKQADYKISTLK
jgi:tetratricopeptide (TPR) repeat protein